MIYQETWEYEIAPGLPAGVALWRLRFYLAALEAAGIDIPSGTVGGRGATVRQRPRREDDADLRALVDAKWEAIEAGQLANAAAQAARSATAAAIQAAQAPVIDIGRTAVAADVAAAPALLPGAAQRARDARRRDDEDALILLLLES